MEEDNKGNIQQNIQDNQNSQQNAGFLNSDNQDSSSIKGNGQRNNQNTNGSNIVGNDTTTVGTGAVVSLKGGITQKEIDERKRIDELKKRAVKLERKLTPKELELERMHREAVRPIAPIATSLQKNTKVRGSQGTQPENKTSLDRGEATTQNIESSKQEQNKHTDQIKQVENLINPVEKPKIKTEYSAVKSQNTPVSKNKTKSINQTEIIPERRMVISPTGQISYVKNPESEEHRSVLKNDKKEATSPRDTKIQSGKTFSTKPSRNIIDLKDEKEKLDNNLNNNQSVEENKIEQEAKVAEIPWEETKVDLKALSFEKRSDIQATPSMASIHLNMDDDLNGGVANWFEEYNKLPVNIKLGLEDSEIRQKIKEFANKFGLITSETKINEKNLGEISRITRDTYVKLIKADEIKIRLQTVLKLKKAVIDEALEDIGNIVATVKDIGNKKNEEYFERLSIKNVLVKYPNIATQEITTGMITNKQTKEYIDPTVQNWIDDYINQMGSGSHTNLERGRYLNDFINTKNLDQEDKEKIEKLTKSYDEGASLIIDRDEQIILWNLHDDESKLGINSDKNKRVINKFKIEEAQSADIDKKESKTIKTKQNSIKQNSDGYTTKNNLENSRDDSIMNNDNQEGVTNATSEKVASSNKKIKHKDDEEILNLSSEIENLR